MRVSLRDVCLHKTFRWSHSGSTSVANAEWGKRRCLIKLNLISTISSYDCAFGRGALPSFRTSLHCYVVRVAQCK